MTCVEVEPEHEEGGVAHRDGAGCGHRQQQVPGILLPEPENPASWPCPEQ